MNNDFTGNELHKARRHDLMREAKGGWLLKQAREAESAHNAGHRVPPVLLIGAILVIGVLLLTTIGTF
jgi:hypothetical protein